MTAPPANIIALQKDNGQRFVFFFDDTNAAIRQFGAFASDPELDFSWYDVAYLAKKLRDQYGDIG